LTRLGLALRRFAEAQLVLDDPGLDLFYPADGEGAQLKRSIGQSDQAIDLQSQGL
jgi:hypothetical protein